MTLILAYLTVNRRRPLRVDAMGEEVASEMNKKMPEGELREIKTTMFRPPTWAVFVCKLEVQSEVDSKHAKRYVLGLISPWEADEKIHQIRW